MPRKPKPEWVSIAVVVARKGCDRKTVRRACIAGELEHMTYTASEGDAGETTGYLVKRSALRGWRPRARGYHRAP